MVTPRHERANFEARLANVRDALAKVELKLAGAPPSEQSATDQLDRDKLVSEEERLVASLREMAAAEAAERGIGGIRFVNREHELEQLIRPTCPQYVVIEAPAGYGKTYLLRELQRRINGTAESSVCLLASVPQLNGQAQTAFVGPNDLMIAHGRLGDPGLVDNIVAHAARPGRTNVTILFDAMEHLVAQDSQFFWDGVVLSLERRLSSLVDLRVVFSGRRVSSTWQGSFRHRLHRIELEPFHERAVIESVQEASRVQMGRSLRRESIQLLAREVVEITGGHPRAIAGMVADFSEYGFALDLDSASPGYAFRAAELRSMADRHLLPALDEIYRLMQPQVGPIMYTLSVFRGFNANVISTLLRAGLLESDSGPLEILSLLSQQTWLVSPPSGTYPMYRDAIVRRLSASVMRINEPERYLQLTRFAGEVYRSWVAGVTPDGGRLPQPPTDQFQLFFAVESIYHSLDAFRIDPPPPDLPAVIGELTRQLVSSLTCTFGELRDLQAQFWQMLQDDKEIWSVLARIGGEDAADGFAQQLARAYQADADPSS